MNRLVVSHVDKLHERWTLVCDHGTSEHESLTESAQEMERAKEALQAAHYERYGCSCRSDVLVDEWPSLADALRSYIADMHPRTPGWTPQLAAFNKAVVECLAVAACPECDPAIRIAVAPGFPEFRIDVGNRHQPGCPTAPRVN